MRIGEDTVGVIAKDNNVGRSAAGVARNAACFLPRRDARIARDLRGRCYATARGALAERTTVDTCCCAALADKNSDAPISAGSLPFGLTSIYSTDLTSFPKWRGARAILP